MDLKWIGCEDVDWHQLAPDCPVAPSCEHSTNPLGFI